MMSTLLLNAMRWAVECGAISTEDVIAWADRQIVAIAEPEAWLFDLSLAKDLNQLLMLLNVVAEDPDKMAVARQAFALFRDGINAGKTSYATVTRTLYRMAFAGYSPHADAVSTMMILADELEDARLGIYGDVVTVKADCLALLDRYQSDVSRYFKSPASPAFTEASDVFRL